MPALTSVVRTTKVLMFLADVGFLCYWFVTLAGLIPANLAFRDAGNPIVSDWNYSFLPLDIAASVTGLTSLCRAAPGSRALMLVSLALTATAGLQAVSFWALRGDYDPIWWTPNLFLLLFPLPVIVGLTRAGRD